MYDGLEGFICEIQEVTFPRTIAGFEIWVRGSRVKFVFSMGDRTTVQHVRVVFGWGV